MTEADKLPGEILTSVVITFGMAGALLSQFAPAQALWDGLSAGAGLLRNPMGIRLSLRSIRDGVFQTDRYVNLNPNWN